MILTVTPNPCVDKTLTVEELYPGEKHRNVKVGCVAGGKGNNVARCVRTLGHAAGALLIVGGHTGRHVLEMLEQEDGVRCIPFWTQQATRTITTIRESNRNRQTALFEPGPALTPDEVGDFLALFRESLHGVEMVTLNGAVPCATMEKSYAAMTRIARDTGIRVLLDSYGPEFDEALNAVPWCVKINREEAAQWTGYDLTGEETILRTLDNLKYSGIELRIITDGAMALYAAWEDQRIRVTPPRVKEVNPVGSGDVFAGALCVAIVEGKPMEEAITFAAAAGAANAQCWDIGHFDAAEVSRLQQQVGVERL